MIQSPSVARFDVPEGRIRCVAFDAVGTLIYPEPAVAQVYFDVARRYGSRLTPADVGSRFKAAFRATERNDVERSDLDESRLCTSEQREFERWREIVSRVVDDVTDPQGAFEELYAHFARPESWRCFDDTADALEQLASRGYQLVIASNFDQRLESVCNGLKELHRIQRLAISSKIGYRKPSPQFFKALSAMTECLPSQLLMIGDDWENDVLGATAAGLSALFLNRSGAPKSGEIRSLREIYLTQ